MTLRLTLLSVALLCTVALPTPARALDDEDPLRHRGLAGFGYRAVSEHDSEYSELAGGSGVLVTRILPDMPAERGGLTVGDVIVEYGNHAITDVSSLLDVTGQQYAGDAVDLVVLRDGERAPLTLTLMASVETSDEIDIEYTSFTSSGVRLRAVVTSPRSSEAQKLPAVLIVSALGSPRLIDMPTYSMRKELAYAAAGAGFRALRFELRGCGDSEGEDFRTTDFQTEFEDNLAALDHLMSRDDVDESRVFVMGHSTGGMIAAMVATERELAGLVVSCTVGRTFYERMVETVRLQSELDGDSQIETDKDIVDYLLLTTGIARGETLEAIVERHPELSRFVNSNGRIMDDRSPEYWRQQLNLSLAETYARVDEPVLIVYAKSDFLTQLACHKRIRDVLAEAGNTHATLTVIDNLDHAYAYASDRRASFEHYKTGSFKENPEGRRQILDWIEERLDSRD